MQVNASYYTTGSNYAQTFTWTSSNNAVATVDSTGKVTAHSEGSATITATHTSGCYSSFNVRIYASFEEIMTHMSQLYDLAYTYKNGDTTLAIELLFNFIRGKNYNNKMWSGIAGEWNSDFKNYVLNQSPNVYNFFMNRTAQFYDYSNNSGVDFVHMCATLNRLFYTGSTTIGGFPTLGLADNYANNLSGWAGDFQTLIVDYFNLNNDYTEYSDIYDCFYSMLGNDNYSFSMPDVLADMDSFNLYDVLKDQNFENGNDFVNCIKAYYTNTSGICAARRFSCWCKTDDKNTIGVMARSYTIPDYVAPGVYWPLLENVPYPTYEEQTAFAYAFRDFIWTLRSYE